MHGLWAALGPTARDRQLNWGIAAKVQDEVANNLRVQRRSPLGQPAPAWQGSSRSGAVKVFIDGDLIADGLPINQGLGAHISAFAEAIESRGVDSALEGLAGGSFVALILDGAGRAILVRDPFGTIPVYEAQAGPDWLISTNPLALAREVDVDSTPDRTGLASWALVGYTIGTRYLVRGIHSMGLGLQRIREPNGALKSKVLNFNLFAQIPLADGGPSVAAIADAFVRSCARLAAEELPTAHMQSGGMDSRLILAAWPGTCPIACYGYGDPHSGEVAIARQVARMRNVSYCHAQPGGDEVAQMLPDVYEASGLMVFPERWHLADRMAADGHLRVLDGYVGGAVLGGAFSTTRRTWHTLLDKLRARYRDASIDAQGLDVIAADIYSLICELPAPSSMAGYLSPDFVAELESARDDVIADVRDELERLRPANDSVALLFRNFILANRTAHAIALQGVLSRRTLAVAFPYATDKEFLQLALSIPLARAAYRRLHIEIFRQRFPRYAEIPYGGGSMLPLRRSAASHQVSRVLLGRGIQVPGLTGSLTRSPNNWGSWLQESQALRDVVANTLRAGGIAGEGLQASMDKLADGTWRASGKLLHLASIGRWLEGARTVG